MDFDRIIASRPANATAAMVAKGSNEDVPLTPQQRRENLIGILRKLEYGLRSTTDPEHRRRFGLQKLDVQNAIKALKTKIPKRQEMSDFIIQVVKERVTKAAWLQIVEEAAKRAAATPPPRRDSAQSSE